MGLFHPTYKVSLVDGKPQLFLERELRCRNKKCENYDKVVKISRNPIDNVEAE